jgi:hypothetical protein
MICKDLEVSSYMTFKNFTSDLFVLGQNISSEPNVVGRLKCIYFPQSKRTNFTKIFGKINSCFVHPTVLSFLETEELEALALNNRKQILYSS